MTGAGLVAGVVNVLAGGGSLISVPLLVFLGLPGDIANGTNRVGILVQNLTAIWRFRRDGVPGIRAAVPVLIPIVIGSVVGATAIAQLPAEQFEQLFGVFMVLLLIPTLRKGHAAPELEDTRPPWPAWLRFSVFFAIGLYGGAIQAGVGLLLLLALSRAGRGLVEANSIKVVVVGLLTLVAVPIFLLNGQIDWLPALFLVIGFGIGGWAGARLAVVGGERLIRPVLAVAVIVLAGRMLSLY